VVIGPCVGVFEASPGNCTAVWGLIEGTAFMAPGACVAVAKLPDDGMDEVGTLKGSEATVPVEVACVVPVEVACVVSVVIDGDENSGVTAASF
jgi:hypothetical protein